MVQELRLFRFVDGVNDTPFPNKEANDEQIVITSFTYNAQRMAATPTITASINYPRCLDNDWDVNVYATFNNEKYYIRQIPSSSKDNTNVMYKHDLTLYSERFILENIYFTDIEKKTENGVDVFVKRETTNIIYRFNLIEYVERLNWSLETSGLPYRVYIDSSIENSEKAKETKDIALEHAYLSSAIQEIYNQWEIPFYFEGNNIIVNDCSENINDVVLEYGAENSLLSIKKNNANFRKITRISGYGSDKNIPFYYPNWSQKGVIDAMPLSTNSKLTKSMLTITDMKKFDKKMPLNGKVEWIIAKDYANKFSYDKNWNVTKKIDLGSHSERYLFHTNAPYGFIEVTIPIAIKQTFEIGVPSKYDASMWQEYDENLAYSWDEIAKRCAATFDIPTAQFATFAMQTVINASVIEERPSITNVNIYNDITIGRRRVEVIQHSLYTFTALTSSTDKVTSLLDDEFPRSYYVYMFPKLSINENVQAEINYGTITLKGIGNNNKDQKITKNVIAQTMGNTSIVIGYGKSNLDGYQSEDINIVYSVTQNSTNGWYLNETKKINLEDIGISVNGTPDNTWNGEGFTQEVVSKIPTAQNLMPSLYRNSIGERKFYNAINYPRSAGSNDQDGASGEMLNGLMYENENYKDNGGYYNFETLWTPTNQNEHIQDFEDIYPSITNVTNGNNEPIDEILEVAFDDNDNNEVDEEGKYIHPYFYVRIPQFSGDNGFNLFDHKIVGEEMQVAMTSGDCAACNFKIMVRTQVSEGNETYEDVINPIKTKIYMGKRVPVDGDSNKITAGNFGSEDKTQQDSRNGSIWLVLEKDSKTFNETYPNYTKGVYPKVGDKFVLLNIDVPKSYVLEAEEKLTKEVIKYMSENNSDKWNFDIDFSRIFLQENQNFYSRLDENCKLYVKYNGLVYNFYVNNYKYEVKANEALPKITVGLVDTITINRGVTQNIVDGVMKAIQQTYDIEESVDNDALYFRKSIPETITHKTTFDNDVDVNGNLNVGEIKLKKIQSPMYGGDEVMGTGFKLEEDENGNSTLIVDNVNVRKKLKATEFVIQQIQFQGGIVIQSAAAMECNRVETLSNGNFKCYFDTKEGSVSNQFMLDDLARCQRVGYAPKYYWRKVVEVGSDFIVLSNVNGEYESNSDTPSEGDIIVQMGNTTNTDRQSAIEMNTVGENSPSFIMYSGINSFSLVEKDVTGIVYHQKVVDENGNVTIEAYPELYSYGSMYFGDRDKQENFIQFAPNTNGTFEMLINAKTSFQGGTTDLGTALDGLLSGIQGGGVNLVTGSASGKDWSYGSFTDGVFYIKNTSSSEKYIKSPQNMALPIGTYTLSFDMKAVNAKKGIQAWLIDSDWAPALYKTIKYEDITDDWARYTWTFELTEKGDACYIRFDNDGNNDGLTTELWLRRIKLEKGTIATDWSISPDDVKQAIAEAEDRTMEALASEVLTINGGIDALQKQVDGEVNSWFMEGEPTLNNAPAKDWTTDELKQRHEGDTYTDISEITLLGSWLWEQGGYVGNTGNAYESATNIRTKDFIENKGGVLFVPSGYQIGIIYYNSNNEWQKVVWAIKNTQLDTNYPKFKLNFSSSSSNNTTPIYPSIADELKLSINPTSGQSWRWCNCTYTDESGTTISGWHWHKIADSDAVKALAEAGKAQATADGKSTIFVNKPTKYNEGDMWVLQSDTDHTAGKKGDILNASQDSDSYDPSHWSKEVKYTDDTAVENLQIGGTNLAIYKDVKTFSNLNKIGNFGFKQITADTKTDFELKIDNFYSSSSYDRWSSNAIISEVGRYSYYIKTTYSTSQIRVGANGSQRDSMAVFPLKEVIPSGTNIAVSVEITNITQGSYEFKNVQIEIGNKATAWKPNDADIIEARENILKDAMLVKAVSTGDAGSKEIILNRGLKPNTEYVASIENIIVNNDPNNSANISFTIWSQDGKTLLQHIQIPITSNKTKNILTFTTQSNISSTNRIWIYPGVRGSSVNGDFTFVGLKLAEGNKYTGWEGTPDEQQALMALSSAMKGTTDIIGGLMLTNLIGMKGEDSKINAGISGLDDWDKLRFWAGSSWEGANTAPFRVYNDGRVFGTHFYGFEPALEINNDNYDTYAPNGTLNIGIVGSKVLLNFSGLILNTSTTKFISLPINERYIGAEIEIFNPSGLPINLCSLIPEYPTVTVDNFYTKNATQSTNYYYYQGYKWAYIKKTCSINDYKTYKYIKLKCMPTQMILKTNDSALVTITNALPNRSVEGYTQFYLWTIEKCIE